MLNDDKIVQIGYSCGVDKAAILDVSLIPFRPEFRAMCEMNTCGKYNRCWMCPPDVGPIEPMIEEARCYQKAFVFQTIGTLEDSFDIEGMEAAAKRHNQITQQLAKELIPMLEDALIIGAGACQVCDTCSRVQDMPCRHPEKAIASLESYGIAVSELAPLCDMNYINGAGTVTYFGAFLFLKSNR